MAKYLNRLSTWMKSVLSVSFIALMTPPCSVVLASDELVDPTMPSMAAAAAVANAGRLNTVSAAVPVLQSVLWSPTRKLAVISGKAYKVGDKVGEAILIKVSVHAAVLRNSDSTLQTLNMHPQLVKKTIVPLPTVRFSETPQPPRSD